jgi:hypothetical protein
VQEEEQWEEPLQEREPGEVVPDTSEIAAPAVQLPPTSRAVLPSLEEVMRARAGIRVVTAREQSPLSTRCFFQCRLLARPSVFFTPGLVSVV